MIRSLSYTKHIVTELVLCRMHWFVNNAIFIDKWHVYVRGHQKSVL